MVLNPMNHSVHAFVNIGSTFAIFGVAISAPVWVTVVLLWVIHRCLGKGDF